MALSKKAVDLLKHFKDLHRNTGEVSFNSEYYSMDLEPALNELERAGYVICTRNVAGTVTLTDSALKLNL